MTFLLLTEDPQEGQALSARLTGAGERNLCLMAAPADAADALRAVQVDRVVCPADVLEPLRETAPFSPPPRFFPWPERVTEDWLRALTQSS